MITHLSYTPKNPSESKAKNNSWVRQTLNVIGHNKECVPNTLLTSQAKSSELCILLPGFGYTSEAPLFRYPALYQLTQGVDVFRVEYYYVHYREFSHDVLFADVQAAIDTIMSKKSYERIWVMSKSLGSVAMAHVFEHEPRLKYAEAIWLTPTLKNEMVRSHIKASCNRTLIVIGTADKHYDALYLDELRTRGVRLAVIDGADHGIEALPDLQRSVFLVSQAYHHIINFFQLGSQRQTRP